MICKKLGNFPGGDIFLPSSNPDKSDMLTGCVLRNLKPIFIHMKSMFHTKIVCDITFFELHFNILCDTYKLHRQYAGLPELQLAPSNKVKKVLFSLSVCLYVL